MTVALTKDYLSVNANNKEFLFSSLKTGIRMEDGRKWTDVRDWEAVPSKHQPGLVEFKMGDTKVITFVEAKPIRPLPERPSEGQLTFKLQFPKSSFERENTENVEEQNHIQRTMEAIFKEGRVVDTESLCILAGQQVWSVTVFVNILNDEGNVIDASALSVLISLLLFRRPEVSITGEDIIIHSVFEKNPVPLTIHYMPISLSFAIFSQGEIIVTDPTFTEERISDGRMTVVIEAGSREICHLHKKGIACEMDLFKQVCDQALKLSIGWTTRIRKLTS